MNLDIEIKTTKDKNQLYSGIIWIVSAIALAIYATFLSMNVNIPGIKELINILKSIDDKYIYIAAFITMFIEGLYFIGSFFPGSSLVVLIAIISGVAGYSLFLKTLLLIFIGWSFAGLVNIYFAKIYREKIIKLKQTEDYIVRDSMWTTWFPALRSSYEVAQVIEGANILKVFISSLKVRLFATIMAGIISLLIPFVFDINKTSGNENFIVIFIVFSISIFIGIRKIRNYLK